LPKCLGANGSRARMDIKSVDRKAPSRKTYA
jgi:hypothetical protein